MPDPRAEDAGAGREFAGREVACASGWYGVLTPLPSATAVALTAGVAFSLLTPRSGAKEAERLAAVFDARKGM